MSHQTNADACPNCGGTLYPYLEINNCVACNDCNTVYSKTFILAFPNKGHDLGDNDFYEPNTPHGTHIPSGTPTCPFCDNTDLLPSLHGIMCATCGLIYSEDNTYLDASMMSQQSLRSAIQFCIQQRHQQINTRYCLVTYYVILIKCFAPIGAKGQKGFTL